MYDITDNRLKNLLDIAIKRGASDLHILSKTPPVLRVESRLVSVPNEQVLTPETTEHLIFGFMTPPARALLLEKKEMDFSFEYLGHRFRANVYFQKGTLAASLRLIPSQIKTLAELNLPPILEKFTKYSQGLFIVAGPTGHGKSTALASMVELINQERSEHIVTIEDPVEYQFIPKKSIISQRELGVDTLTFGKALRSVLREDPNVVLVGEMRDLETIETVLTVAETGHLVLTTLHTNSAAQTADRIVDVFPEHIQQQVRQQLASVLLGIASERLLPKTNGGLVPAMEILVANSSVRNLIREGKTHQLPNVIQTSASEGMISLDKVLAELVSRGEVALDDALAWSLDPRYFKTLLY